MIEVRNLTKRYGDFLAVDDMTFTVEPGIVTGFLGPNGAGKSTTMRMILGLDRPTSGSATVNGQPLRRVTPPRWPRWGHCSRRGRSTRAARPATTCWPSGPRSDPAPPRRRPARRRRPGRRGRPRALAGSHWAWASGWASPPRCSGIRSTVMLDEPVNGLDPDGIQWIRTLLKELAAEGRTVFVSSHLMSEMEMTAEHLVIVGRGKVLADVSMADFIAASSRNAVRVISPDSVRLTHLLAGPGVSVSSDAPGQLEISGMPAARVGELAAREGLVLHELVDVAPSLEEAFMELTRDAVEYHGSTETTGRAAA